MSRSRLQIIYEEIGRRTGEIAAARGDWPCRRGCDACCRQLAGAPVFTRLEWEELWRGFVALDGTQRAEVRARVAELDRAVRADPPPEHVACPLLDPSSGSCMVYAHRPAICRAYGFYAARDAGSWCEQIEREVVPTGGDIVWGNQDALDDALSRIGLEPVDISSWFEQHPE